MSSQEAAAAAAPATLALTDTLPQGTAWMLRLHPRAIVRQAALRTILESVVPEVRLQRFATDNEIDLRELEELVIAAYEDHPLYLARGAVSAPYVVDMFGIRLAPIESSAEMPLVRRAGFLAQQRYEIAALDGRTLALVRGLTASIAPVAGCHRHEVESQCGLSEDERTLIDASSDADVLFVMRGAWRFPEGTAIARVLRDVRASSLRLDVHDSQAEIRIDMLGAFPEHADDAVRGLVATIASSDLGQLFGLSDSPDTVRVRLTTSTLSLSVRVDSTALSEGLRNMLRSSMTEIVDSL